MLGLLPLTAQEAQRRSQRLKEYLIRMRRDAEAKRRGGK